MSDSDKETEVKVAKKKPSFFARFFGVVDRQEAKTTEGGAEKPALG